MSQHKLSTSSRSVLNSGLTDDYRQALSEYIWNGFDAGASCVEIRYTTADALGNFDYLMISDNGKGIRRDTLEYTFGRFLDSQKQQSYQRTSDVRGKKGKGRFSFQKFAHQAEWITRYINTDGKLMQYAIRINVEDLSNYEITEETELDQNVYSTGTEVRFTNIHDLSTQHLELPACFDYLSQQFAWFLCLNQARGYTFKINGVALSYDDLIDCEEECQLQVADFHFDVTYIRWTRKISDKFYFYMMNSNCHENFKELTSFNNNNINFFHSVYVKSSYFDRFVYEKSTGTRWDGFVNQSDSVFKRLMKDLKAFLVEKEKAFVSEIAATKLIEDYEANGVLPHFKASEYDQIRKKDLTDTIKQIYTVQPKVFKGLNKEQQKTMVAFLNLLLDSEERDKILFILDGIVSLSDDERTQLANVLHSTTMQKISKVARMMHDRLEAKECLKQLVYDLTKFTTERTHIQKIIEKCFWLFGEQYNLVSADVTFERALAAYLNVLNPEGSEEKNYIDDDERNRRPDIFLCRQQTVNDAVTSSMLEENIIVELKRPSVDIGIKQYRQIEDYLNLIKKEPKFNSESRIWRFIVVGKVIEEDVKERYDSFKLMNKRYLVYQQGRFEIYAMSWDDVFKEFDYRHHYILSKLEFSNESIKQEIEQVQADVSGSDSLTQKILALDV